MEIIVGKTAGFCYGVKNAVDKTKETVQKQNETYCLGELVHNKQVTQDLERHGLVIINNIEILKRYYMNYVYILRCNDDSLYTGWTNNLEKRIKAHSDGKGAKYTRARVPVELVYFEVFEDKIEAMKREYAIKQLKRKEKLELIKNSKCIKS